MITFLQRDFHRACNFSAQSCRALSAIPSRNFGLGGGEQKKKVNKQGRKEKDPGQTTNHLDLTYHASLVASMTQTLLLVHQSICWETPAISQVWHSCLVIHWIGCEKQTKPHLEEKKGGLEWGGGKSLHETKINEIIWLTRYFPQLHVNKVLAIIKQSSCLYLMQDGPSAVYFTEIII